MKNLKEKGMQGETHFYSLTLKFPSYFLFVSSMTYIDPIIIDFAATNIAIVAGI